MDRPIRTSNPKREFLNIRFCVFLGIAWLIAARPACSAIVTVSDRASWAAASAELIHIDFEGIAPSAVNTEQGLTIGGVNFVGPGEQCDIRGCTSFYRLSAGFDARAGTTV